MAVKWLRGPRYQGNVKTTQARLLRSQMTEAENKMWRLLRHARLKDLKFRRQVPFGNCYSILGDDYMTFDHTCTIFFRIVYFHATRQQFFSMLQTSNVTHSYHNVLSHSKKWTVVLRIRKKSRSSYKTIQLFDEWNHYVVGDILKNKRDDKQEQAYPKVIFIKILKIAK